MRKRWLSLLLVLLLLGTLVGCRDKELYSGSGPCIYYQNLAEDNLVKVSYEFPADTAAAVKKALADLTKQTTTKDYKSVFAEDLKVEKYEVVKSHVSLYLSPQYERLSRARRLLLQAAVVGTLTQIPAIASVEFFVNGKPLADSTGAPRGALYASDFVQNIGSSIHSTQEAGLVLYFANAAGTKLVPAEKTVRYNSNASVEKLVVDQLLKGPSAKNQLATLPEDATVLNVTVKERICYVNFSDTFNNSLLKINPELTIYSIVNSLVSLPQIDKVQISIDGSSDTRYQSIVDLSKPLTENKEIVESK